MTVTCRYGTNILLTVCIVLMILDLAWKNATTLHMSSPSSVVSTAGAHNINDGVMVDNGINTNIQGGMDSSNPNSGLASAYGYLRSYGSGLIMSRDIPRANGLPATSAGSNAASSSFITNSLLKLDSSSSSSNKMLDELNGNVGSQSLSTPNENIVLVRPEPVEISIDPTDPQDSNTDVSTETPKKTDGGKSDEDATKDLEALIEEIFQKEVEIRKTGNKQPPPQHTRPSSTLTGSSGASKPKSTEPEPLTPVDKSKSEKVASEKGGKAYKNELVPHPKDAQRMIFREKLLSLNRPVWADVRGYLGLPSVVTSESTNKQTDRWQASLDMRGIPIGGHHWLRIDLGRLAYISRMLIDWEEGYSLDYAVHGRVEPLDDCGSGGLTGSAASTAPSEGCLNPKEGWIKIFDTKDSRKSGIHLETTTSFKHVIHEFVTVGTPTTESQHGLTFGGNTVLAVDGTIRESDLIGPFRVVKLLIRSPATKWGSSVWRWQVWGAEQA
jgi:hypothetical protein